MFVSLFFMMVATLRCQDETENETYISAIRCTKCPGYFLPENPIGAIHTQIIHDHGGNENGGDVRLGGGGGGYGGG